MAIKNIVARGAGFGPGSVKFVVTFGFVSAELRRNLFVAKVVKYGQNEVSRISKVVRR